MNVILFESMPEGGFVPASDERFVHVRDILALQSGDSFQMGIVGGAKGLATILDMGEDGMRISFTPIEKDASEMYPVLSLIHI